MNNTHLVIQSVLMPLVSMWYVAPLFLSRPRGLYLRLILVFFGFFLLNMFFLMERYDLFDAVLRSAAVGVIPLIAGYLWARYG
jgi:hypothetical protein